MQGHLITAHALRLAYAVRGKHQPFSVARASRKKFTVLGIEFASQWASVGEICDELAAGLAAFQFLKKRNLFDEQLA